MTTRWLHEDVQSGVVTYRLGRDGEAIVAEWRDLATYRSDRSPRFVASDRADPIRVGKIEAGAARALDRALDGRWSLHGAAFAIEGEGVLLVGESGAGKSTIAAACVAAGGELLADDIAFVDDIGGVLHLVPGENLHWIASADATRLGSLNLAAPPESNGSSKAPFQPRAVALSPVPVRMVCEVIAGGSEIAIEALRGAAAMRAISTALFLLPSADSGPLATHFESVARIARETEVVRIRRPASVDPGLVASAIHHARIHVRV